MNTKNDNTTTAPALTAAAGYAAKLQKAKDDLMQSRRDLLSIEVEMENKRKAIRMLEVDVKTYELLAQKEADDEAWDNIQSMSKEELREMHGLTDDEIEANCQSIRDKFSSHTTEHRQP